MARGDDLHRPAGANFASPASPVDLDEAEPPPAKKARRADLNAQDSDADSEDESEEPQSKRVRFDEYEDEHYEYGHDAESDDLSFQVTTTPMLLSLTLWICRLLVVLTPRLLA